MGLLLTLLYLLTAMVTPTTLFGPLAEYHAEVVIAGLTLLCSFFNMRGSGVLRMPQVLAIGGLTLAVALSLLFAGLAGEIPSKLLDFIPAVAAFFFVAWNCKTKKHLQIVIAVLLSAAFYIIFRGYEAQASQDLESMYVISMRNGSGETFFRTRGLGFINDPNDLAQFLAGLVPCVFFFWVKGKALLNAALVYVPVTILLYGMYLTHSRGAMLALMAAAVVAGRRKIGTLPASIGGAVVFIGLSAVGWSGGRDVSAASGADRTEAWAAGLMMIRAHPLFGVGYLRYAEYFYITAHNTIVVCAAELGVFGFFFWVMLIFTTIHEMVTTATAARKTGDIPENGPEENLALRIATSEAAEGLAKPGLNYPADLQASMQALTAKTQGLKRPDRAFAKQKRWDQQDGAVTTVNESQSDRVAAFPQPQWLRSMDDESLTTDADLRRMARLMMISFTAFLTAGWFLSRAYTLPLFMNAGMAAVIYRLARSRGITRSALGLGRTFRISGMITVGLILLVYVGLRLDSVMSR